MSMKSLDQNFRPAPGAGLTVGCASTSDLQKVQNDANEAKSMARNAMDTANEAKSMASKAEVHQHGDRGRSTACSRSRCTNKPGLRQ